MVTLVRIPNAVNSNLHWQTQYNTQGMLEGGKEEP